MTARQDDGISGTSAQLDARVPRKLGQIPGEIAIPDDAACVFASGSLVAGWGHATSDVDLYVVTAAPAPVTPTATFKLGLSSRPLPVVAAFGPDGMRYDIEYWTTGQVDELLSAVQDAGDRDHAAVVQPGRADIDWFFRLSIGVAIAGEEWLREAQRKLADSALAVILAGQEFEKADGFVDDALGLSEVGDQESAVLAARAALGHAVDGYLFALGSFCPGVKWRYRKVIALPASALPAEKYWRLETMRDLDPDNVRPWVEQVAETCQELMMEVDFS
jgi:hypothetical protein